MAKYHPEHVIPEEETEETQDPDIVECLCSECNEKCCNFIQLIEHYYKQHRKPQENLKCAICLKIFQNYSKSELIVHVRSDHLNAKKFWVNSFLQ